MLKKEYVRTAILLGVVVISVFAFWIGLTTALGTEYPVLAVASGSMVPALHQGDLIMVQGVSNVCDIVVGGNDTTPPGDIIVFHSPTSRNDLIVHRAIEKELRDGECHFKTQGDHNNSEDRWTVSEEHVVGRVIGRVSSIGYIPLFLREFLWTPVGMILIVALLLVFLFFDYIPFIGKKDDLDASQSTDQKAEFH